MGYPEFLKPLPDCKKIMTAFRIQKHFAPETVNSGSQKMGPCLRMLWKVFSRPIGFNSQEELFERFKNIGKQQYYLPHREYLA